MTKNSNPINQAISKRFTRDEIMLVSTPLFLIVIAIIAVLIAPKILRSWEIDRCLEVKGTYNYDKDECVVTAKTVD
jgi:hypothetical protein